MDHRFISRKRSTSSICELVCLLNRLNRLRRERQSSVEKHSSATVLGTLAAPRRSDVQFRAAAVVTDSALFDEALRHTSRVESS